MSQHFGIEAIQEALCLTAQLTANALTRPGEI